MARWKNEGSSKVSRAAIVFTRLNGSEKIIKKYSIDFGFLYDMSTMQEWRDEEDENVSLLMKFVSIYCVQYFLFLFVFIRSKWRPVKYKFLE